MASGGSLKTKLPSFTSTSWLRAQPPASSANLSSKMISVPSQAEAWGKPARQSIAAANKTWHLAMSGSLAGLTRPTGKIHIASAEARQPWRGTEGDSQMQICACLGDRQPPSTSRTLTFESTRDVRAENSSAPFGDRFQQPVAGLRSGGAGAVVRRRHRQALRRLPHRRRDYLAVVAACPARGGDS